MSEQKDESGIEEELAIQLDEVRKELGNTKKQLDDIKKEVKIKLEMETLDAPFLEKFFEENKPLKITGVALSEGIWKNTVYTHEEIEKAAKDLIGKPIKVEHGRSAEFKDKTVGKITGTRFDSMLEALIFEGIVEDERAKELVKDNTLKAVSCSTWMEKKPIGTDINLGYDFRFAELSLVENPACDRAFIFHLEQLMKMKDENQDNIIKEEKKQMEIVFEKVPESEELSSEVKDTLMVLVEVNPGELGIVELESLEELIELMKSKKVVSYYKGYPGSYPKGDKEGYKQYRYPYKKPAKATIDEEAKKKKYPYYPYGKYPSKEQNDVVSPVIDDSLPFPLGPEERSFLEKRFGKKLVDSLMGLLGQEEMSDLWELDNDELAGKLVIKKNPKSGKFMVFQVPEKGLWKILKAFDSEKEAKDFVESGGKAKEEKAKEKPKDEVCPVCKKSPCVCPEEEPEEEAAEEKDEHGCIVGKEEYDEKEKKCIPLPAEKMSAWTDCIGKERKAGKSFAESVKECKIKLKMEQKSAKIVCPVCKKEFKDEKELQDHWVKEHEQKYGKYGEYKPEEKAKSFKCPKCGKEFKDEKELEKHMEEEKLSGTEVNKEEIKAEPPKTPETPLPEPLKKEEPKKEEPKKAEEPKKEEPKVRTLAEIAKEIEDNKIDIAHLLVALEKNRRQ